MKIANMIDLSRFYTDRADFLHAREKNVDGRICKSWEPVPDPCNPNKLLTNVGSQFKHDSTFDTVSGNRTIETSRATLDIPCVFDCVTTRNRVRVNGCLWDVVSVQHDSGIAMRLKLEMVSS